ncbi:MAG: sodium-dependent bicarbonate transport family permease [Candidatus Marinimicrobia bacterium]|nr:sodium-dependent bicarbonate transport family permease [Candidatus Neomarinimicrobiota bacterium]
MLENLLDPVVLCFVLGLIAGIAKSDLKLPEALYETLSIYLLLAIGLKGGVELSKATLGQVVMPSIGTLFLGLSIPVIAFPILKNLGKLSPVDSAAVAAHYGSVSAVTFAVVLTFLTRLQVPYEGFTTVLLVLLEIPAIAIGVFIAKSQLTDKSRKGDWGKLAHEVFMGKSILLLVGGLLIGWMAGPDKMQPIQPVFSDLFKGALAFFLLEMGIVTSHKLASLKSTGAFLVAFGILMPIFSGILGSAVGLLTGLSIGGATVLATLAASASYIAAPAAMRIAVPQANPTLYLTASLGITFPFNIVFGIPIYYAITQFLHALGG